MATVVDPAMEDPESVAVRDAATVMLVRDGPAGVEVCMMMRNLNSDFVGGAYVFPGGAVDPDDSSPEALALCVGLDDEAASALVGTERAGLSFWVAAIRESFEEAGVLLARHGDGRPLGFADDGLFERFERHRADVDFGRRSIAAVMLEEDLRFDVAGLHCFARWITPLGAHRRYDTRFFVARAPVDQEIAHDDRELVASRWITPSEALRRVDAGEMVMIFPTIRTLLAIEHFERASNLLDWAAGFTDVPAWLPTVTTDGDRSILEVHSDIPDVGGRFDADTARPVA